MDHPTVANRVQSNYCKVPTGFSAGFPDIRSLFLALIGCSVANVPGAGGQAIESDSRAVIRLLAEASVGTFVGSVCWFSLVGVGC